MVNDRPGRVGKLPACRAPASTNFTVLGRGETCRESVHPPEVFGGNGEIVGSKEAGVVRIGVEIGINGVNDRLACFRIRVLRERVDRAAADDAIRSRDAMRSQFSQPSRVRLAIVIRESEEFPPRLQRTMVTCGARPRLFLLEQLERKRCLKLTDDFERRGGASIVPDHDFITCAWVVETS